jgi:hypothetical protein
LCARLHRGATTGSYVPVGITTPHGILRVARARHRASRSARCASGAHRTLAYANSQQQRGAAVSGARTCG